MLIDTHCHLTDEKLFSQLPEVLARAQEAGVGRILVPTVGILDGMKAIEIASKHEEVWAMVGVDPEVLADENQLKNRDEWLAAEGEWLVKLAKLARSSDRVIGIGEIGLDFHYDKEKRSKQLQTEIFSRQMELAVELDLPVTIHMRDAEEEMREVLGKMTRLPRGQCHCWAGSEEFLKLVLAKGFYVSFCGNITYKSADDLREKMKLVPLARLLLETDSPYLAPIRQAQGGPEGLRGSLNEPKNVTILAEYIAELLGIETETLINQTTDNAKCLYFGG